MTAAETRAASSLYEPPPSEDEALSDEQLDMVAIQGEILQHRYTAEHEAGQEHAGAGWLPNWYLGIHAECDTVEKRIKEQAKVLQAEVDARRKALAYHWGREFKARVDDDLADQHGKKKSINYAIGKAGYRKTKEKLVILDDAKFISWAKMECPDCLEFRVARKTPAVDHLHETGEVPPGCSLEPAEDRFFPAEATDALPEAPAAPQLPADPWPAEDKPHVPPPDNQPEPNAVDPLDELKEARQAVSDWVSKVEFADAQKVAQSVACKSVDEMRALESVQRLRTAANRLEELPPWKPEPTPEAEPVSAEASAREAF